MMICADAAAYHFWITPDSYNLYPGDEVGCAFWVGTQEERFQIPRNNDRIASFQAHHGRKSEALEGASGAEKAVEFKAKEEGFFLMAYQSTPTIISFANNAFEEYIEKMQVADVSERFHELKNRKGVQSECFVACAKTILRVGQPSSGCDVVCKLPLEIVPRFDPRSLSPGRALKLSLLRKGRPVEGVEIHGWRLDRESEPIIETTNQKGDVRMEIELGGRWIFTAIRMTPEPWDDEETPPLVDWKTHFTTLTLSF